MVRLLAPRQGSRNFAEATVFQTSSNRWETYESWPHSSAQATERDVADSYVSDPSHPVPHRRRPISLTYPGGGWPTWLLEDQRFVDSRPDVLTWQTEPLTKDLKVAGDIAACIFRVYERQRF